MLLIPDIHITSKYADSIIANIKDRVGQHPQDPDVIFLGDYVYAFNYDRKALLQLFELWIHLHHQGKNLYILAGNHDWIGSQFVYEEVKQSRDIINAHSPYQIHFITKPQVCQIQGQTIFFLPYMIDVQDIKLSAYGIDAPSNIEGKVNNIHISQHLNNLLGKVVNQVGTCTLIHHYYVADTEFWPGSGAFTAQDIALDARRLLDDRIRMVSGHIHHPFVYRNYLCLGSVWHTSDREANQIKVCAQRDTDQHQVKLASQRVNPIVRLYDRGEELFTVDDLQTQVQTIFQEHHLQTNQYRHINDTTCTLPEISQLKIQYYTSQDFADAQASIDPQMRNFCRQIEIKKQVQQVSVLIQDLQIQHEKLQVSLTEWREICKKYIMSRYPDDFQTYMLILSQLRILR